VTRGETALAPDRLSTLVKLGAFALALSVVAGGVWAALLVANLRTTPAVPWSVAAMGVVLWVAWQYLSGARGNPRWTSDRRGRLRATRVSGRVFAWALVAGILSITSLTGLWIALRQLIRVRGNTLPDFSRYPLVVVILVIGMGSLTAAAAEEAGFRGYFQGALERRVGAPLAILTAALVILPAHGVTQGFGLTTVFFYLCVDGMLGAMAYLTQSILPGIAVHFIGLAVFFSLIWPHDASRRLVLTDGPDAWFWIHLGQMVLAGVLAVLAFRRLADGKRRA
jgi:membrane protease YdiL (CAAX protease family)